jgi:DNA polymerase-1
MTHRISKKSVFLIDGSSFLYRAYYGLRPLHTSKGQTVHAVYGFCRMIKKLIDDFNIEHMVIVWDSKGKTDRHEIYPVYKATRQEPPSDIFEQKALIQEFADLVGIAQLSKTGKEADDLLYSAALKFNKSGYQSIFVTSDKDMRQALSKDILIFDPFKNTVMDDQDALKRYEFEVSKIPFYFSIVGDTSDNIPGVKGIGDKGATELVKQFDDLDDLYKNLNQIKKPRTQELLKASKDEAYLSYKLFLLHDYAIDLGIENTKFDLQNWAKSLPFFQKLEFKSLIKDVQQKFHTQTSMFESKQSTEDQLSKKYDFVCVSDEQSLQELCEQIQKAGSFAIDTETDGLDPMQAKLIGVSVAIKEGKAFYIPLAHETGEQVDFKIFEKLFGPILKNSAIKKYMHHAKFDQLVLEQAGFVVAGIVFDTMIAASLVTKEWEKNGLKELSQQFFDETMLTYQDTVKQHKAKDFSHIPTDAATKYAAADAHQTLKLVSVFADELKKQDMNELFYGIELPVNDVLVAMQKEGIICDAEILLHLSKQVDHDLKQIESKIHKAAGKEINLNSPKQVRELLFETLQLTPQKKSGTGEVYSTDAQVLSVLAKEHEIPLMLLAYRELYKLKSTYIDALPTYINPKTEKIHTSWNQTLVATGRLSSSNPNLQNIPKDGLEYGKEYDVDVRSAFKAKRGWSFISADYSQIELRVLAQLSKDKNLVAAFMHKKDIHAQTAAKMFDIAQSQVTSEQRSIGKRINFSILYGLTAYGLSRDMGVAYADAKKYIELYFQQYPGVQAWMEEVVEFVKKTGYTKTLYGRRRYLPGIYEKNKNLFELARRIAINTPAQGTAAEITKIGMINFFQALADQKLDGKILLQIHDELLVTCPDDQVEKTAKLLEKSLVQAVKWEIPLEVSIRSGKNWKSVSK